LEDLKYNFCPKELEDLKEVIKLHIFLSAKLKGTFSRIVRNAFAKIFEAKPQDPSSYLDDTVKSIDYIVANINDMVVKEFVIGEPNPSLSLYL